MKRAPCYFGCSIGELDIAAELTEPQRQELGYVTTRAGLDVWFIPAGEFLIQQSWPGVSTASTAFRDGQLLVRLHNAEVVWHVAIISAHNLYSLTETIIQKEKEIHIYLNRRAPLFDHQQVESAIMELREKQALDSHMIRKLMLDSMLPKLPHVCPLCGNETGNPHKVPDEPAGVCPECLARHYKTCWSCGKTTPNQDVKYVDEIPYCASCKKWSKSMGFI